MSAVSMKWGRRGPHYRRRRPLPALLVLGALVVLSAFVWTGIFQSTEDIEAATRCNPPTPPTTAPPEPGQAAQAPDVGKMLRRNALDRTSPIPPQDVHARVLNGNGESRQAAMVSSELGNLGFGEGGAPDNDPIYTNYDLNCHGQIRFGGAGVSSARTLSLVVPCAQLVRDERPDATVDLALGADFDDIKTTAAAKRVLQELKTWVPQRDQQGDAQQEVTPPRIDKALLAQARDVYC